MEQAKFIGNENMFFLITVELFLLALIFWFYKNYRKNKERDYDNSNNYDYGYRRMKSLRIYLLVGIIFVVVTKELIKRLIAIF